MERLVGKGHTSNALINVLRPSYCLKNIKFWGPNFFSPINFVERFLSVGNTLELTTSLNLTELANFLNHS